MRILFVTNCFGDEVNGPVIYARYLWEHFSKHPTIDFHMMVLEAPEDFVHENFHVIPASEQSKNSHVNLRLLGQHAQKFAENSNSTTLVHLNSAHFPYSGDWNRVIANVNDTIVVQSSWFGLIKQYGLKKGISFGLRKRHERYAVENAWRIMSNSQFTSAALEKGYATTDNIRIVYKAVACEEFSAIKLARQQKLDAPSPHKDKTWKMVTVGSNWTYKRLDLLLEALKVLNKTRTDFHLNVYGHPNPVEQTRFQKLTLKLGLEKRVTFNGVVARERLASVFGDSDIYVTASLQEAFGVTVVEALASGLEVVAFSSGGIKEILNPPEFCDYVAAGDTVELANVLSNKMTKPSAESIERLYKRAEKFDTSAMLKRVEQQYREFFE